MSVSAPRAEIIQGDCLAVMRSMAEGSVEAVVTDPPYGTGGRRRGRSGAGRNPSGRIVREEWDEWDVRWVFAAAPLLVAGARIVAFCPATRFGSLMDSASQAGLPYLTHVAWRKLDPMPPYGGRLGNALEYALIFGSGGLRAGNGELNIWEGSAPRERRDADGTGHPHQKPVDLMRWLCRLVTPPGGTVLDPFAGSGSTLVAAALEGFHSIGIERSADYVDIARRRVWAAAQPRLALGD